MIDAGIASSPRPKLRPHARLRTDPVSGARMLVYPEGVLLLNPTGSDILSFCDGTHSIEEIVGSLSARYRGRAGDIFTGTTNFLSRLQQKNLIEMCEGDKQ